jgi:mannose-6-phosphate isomerase-like protein (cupin superfamily)
MLVWLGPNATELPPHVHTHESEYFRTLSGEVTFVVEGEPHRLGPEDDVTISETTRTNTSRSTPNFPGYEQPKLR